MVHGSSSFGVPHALLLYLFFSFCLDLFVVMHRLDASYMAANTDGLT
jgi:hypothetical protein